MFLSCCFQFLALKLYVAGVDSRPLKDSYDNYFHLLLCYRRMVWRMKSPWGVEGFPAEGPWARKHGGVRDLGRGARSLGCHTNGWLLGCNHTSHVIRLPSSREDWSSLIVQDTDSARRNHSSEVSWPEFVGEVLSGTGLPTCGGHFLTLEARKEEDGGIRAALKKDVYLSFSVEADGETLPTFFAFLEWATSGISRRTPHAHCWHFRPQAKSERMTSFIYKTRLGVPWFKRPELSPLVSTISLLTNKALKKVRISKKKKKGKNF